MAMLGLLDWARRDLIVRTSRTKQSSDFIALLEDIDRRYGPKPGVAIKPIVLVPTTAQSTPARQRGLRSNNALTDSRSSGFRNTPRSSTTLKRSGAT